MGRGSISRNGQPYGPGRPKKPKSGLIAQRRSRPLSNTAYQLKVTLKGSRPSIWRRILVHQDCTLDLLHVILQRAMGWMNIHLHDFCIEGRYYGDPAADNILGFKNGCNYSLSDLVTQPRQKFRYEYDFGDNWEHEILLEKIVPLKPGIQCPACLDGERACPPEESGGSRRYLAMTQILSDRKHAHYKETRKWFGFDFDPDEFSLKWVNKQLAELSGSAPQKKIKRA